MNKQCKILGSIYLIINTLFLIPAVRCFFEIGDRGTLLKGLAYRYPLYSTIMEWYSYWQFTGTHWSLALLFMFYCVITWDFSKRYSKVMIVLLLCLVIINVYFNWVIINLYPLAL